jgi:hypothetical protein
VLAASIIRAISGGSLPTSQRSLLPPSSGRWVVDVYRRFRGAYCLHHKGYQWWKFTDVSEVLAATIIRAMSGGRLPTSQRCLLSPSSGRWVVEVYWCFRGACCLNNQGSKHLWKSANFYQTTRRNILEDSHLHIRCRENKKSHIHTIHTYIHPSVRPSVRPPIHPSIHSSIRPSIFITFHGSIS